MSAADLLDAVEDRLTSCMVTYKENATEDAPRLVAALNAVIKVHEPIDALHTNTNTVRQVCTGCGTDNGNWKVWPCPTIRAIEREVQS